MIKRLFSVCLSAAVVFTALSLSAQEKGKNKPPVDVSKIPPASARKDVTYVGDVQPIFEKSCVRCHGPEKPKAKLRMDSLGGILKGGEDGKVLVPGNSAESMLVHNIAHVGDPDQYMPPPKNKAGILPLTTEQIGLIRAWIDQGAK
jgi:mono/diheme cytochrome c family protein